MVKLRKKNNIDVLLIVLGYLTFGVVTWSLISALMLFIFDFISGEEFLSLHRAIAFGVVLYLYRGINSCLDERKNKVENSRGNDYNDDDLDSFDDH